MAYVMFICKGDQYLVHGSRVLMHVRHLGMLATVRFQNSFEISRTLRSQWVSLETVHSTSYHLRLSITLQCHIDVTINVLKLLTTTFSYKMSYANSEHQIKEQSDQGIHCLPLKEVF